MILAYKGTSFFPSRIIRWMSWSEYSHVAWEMKDGRVIEAYQPVVRLTPSLHYGHKPGTVVERFEIAGLTPAQRIKLESFLMRQIGKPYDWASVFRFIPRWAESQKSRNAWFCSELLLVACNYAGVKLFNGLESYKVMPGVLVLSPLLSKIGTAIVGEKDE